MGRHEKDTTFIRRIFSIRPEQTTHFYLMPGWWRDIVLLSAALTGIGGGQVQEALLPGALTLSGGLGLGGLAVWLRWRAKGSGANRPSP